MRDNGRFTPQSAIQHESSAPQPDRLAPIIKTLEQGIDAILDSNQFAAYLRTMSRFHGYSFNNTLLIMVQQPEATQVAGYRMWQQLG